MKRNLTCSLIAFVALCAATLSSAAAGRNVGATTVIVVRHAEKAMDGGNDPHLSEVGKVRAERLAAVLRDAHVRAIYVTQFKRTHETAEPSAIAFKTTVAEMNVDSKDIAGYVSRLAKQIRDQDAGKTVLVVSHSNTVPQIVEALTGVKMPDIKDDEYSRLYIVTVPVSGHPSVVAAQYGY
jgi:broad specificity phosphatase PhoE